jgi:pyruvate dehydrogenase E2 component (dihydrolipoamide acetyltransferase)
MAKAREFKLPDLGEGLEDAEVVAWRVAEGDSVDLNQILVEVNTAKAVVEIPSPWAGVVGKLHAGEGDVVKVGQPLVSIEVDEAAAGEETPASGGETKPKREALLVGYGVDQEDEVARARRRSKRASRAGPDGGGQVRATPPVRKLAKELGVDLAAVTGTGPEGRITREDVEGAAPEQGPKPVTFFDEEADVEYLPVRGSRRLIAEKMERSVREIPHVTTWLTVDASSVTALREELSAESGERISPLPIVVRALAEVCANHPKLNASFQSQEHRIALYRTCNVGIAVDTEEGLVVPVIFDVKARGITDIAGWIDELSDAARNRRLRPEQMQGGTITVTNVGTFGSESGTPIINHPEAAILALGVIEPRALVIDGEVQARPATTLALSFDHRVMDGAEAGRALLELKRLLESPFRLGALPR